VSPSSGCRPRSSTARHARTRSASAPAAVSSAPEGFFCFGDVNREFSQFARGGTVTCIQDKYVHASLYNMIVTVMTNDASIFGVPNFNFLVLDTDLNIPSKYNMKSKTAAFVANLEQTWYQRQRTLQFASDDIRSYATSNRQPNIMSVATVFANGAIAMRKQFDNFITKSSTAPTASSPSTTAVCKPGSSGMMDISVGDLKSASPPTTATATATTTTAAAGTDSGPQGMFSECVENCASMFLNNIEFGTFLDVAYRQLACYYDTVLYPPAKGLEPDCPLKVAPRQAS